MSLIMQESIKSQKSNLSEDDSNNVVKLKQNFMLIHRNNYLSKKGIVFIGNSRIGKSTISSLLTQIKLQVKLYKDQHLLKIQPIDPEHRNNRNLIQHQKTSVTFFPNIHKVTIDNQNYSVIDLPGFKDTSYFKQLCNWRYIKNILEKLDEILFVMVLEVHAQEKQLRKKQLEMMERFKTAFPTANLRQAKKNIVTIINFVQDIETEQKYYATKMQIKQKIKAQLTKFDQDKNENEKIKCFYENAFEPNNMFLIPRVTQQNKQYSNEKQLLKGIPFEEVRLLPFLKQNLNKMQPTIQSPYKINLTKQNNQKSRKLRKIIVQFFKMTRVSMEQKFQIYKNLLSHLLMMLETDGAKLGIEDFTTIKRYYESKNIFQFDSIQSRFQFSDDTIVYQTAEQTVLEIIFLFQTMSLRKQLDGSESMIHWIVDVFRKFINLIQNLCRILFSSRAFQQIQTINQNMLKSVEVESNNLLYLNQSVQNFLINDENENQDSTFLELVYNQSFEMDSNMRRVSNFKDNLKEYIKALIEKCRNLPLKKINIDLLQKLKNAATIMNFHGLKSDTLVLFYTNSHKKLTDPKLIQQISGFQKILNKISQKWISLTVNQRQQLSKWQEKESKQWKIIKCKAYAQIIKYLTHTNFQNQKLIDFYLKTSIYSETLMHLIRKSCSDTEQKAQTQKTLIFNLCIKVGEYFEQNCEFNLAQQCYKLAENIFIFEDQQNVIQAKKKYIQVYRMMCNGQVDIKIEEYSQNLQKNPWKIVTNFDYREIFETAVNHSKTVYQVVFEGNFKNVQRSNGIKVPERVKQHSRQENNFLKPLNTKQKHLNEDSLSQNKNYESPSINKIDHCKIQKFHSNVHQYVPSSEKVIQKQYSQSSNHNSSNSHQRMPAQQKSSLKEQKKHTRKILSFNV